MKINNINNQTNINSKARFDLISNKLILSDKNLLKLAQKARNIGTSADMILIGVTEVQEKKPIKFLSVFGNKFYKKEDCTKITGACHSFFDIESPKSFLENIATIYGNKSERAKKCYEAVNNYLNEIELNLVNKK